MGFGDRKGWDAKIEGREVGKKPSSKPAPSQTGATSLNVYLNQLPAPEPVVEVAPAPAPPPEPPPPPEATEAVEVVVLTARPIRYHSKKNQLSPGLHVLRIGGELTDEALKRIVDFITLELHAQRY
jgi:hypothetical protein